VRFETFSILKDERGATLLVAILLMALLTILGLSALDLSDTEYRMVTNGRQSIRAFYAAESAGKEASSLLETLAVTDKDALVDLTPSWLSGDDLDRSHPATWITSGEDEDEDKVNAVKATVVADGDAALSVVYQGVASAASLDMSGTRLYQYRVFGNYASTSPGDNSVAIIEMGYRLRY